MVSLVFVAHSRALADALVELVQQVAPAGLRMAVAAGTGGERQEFGTDAAEIAAAIQSVYSETGVLVLMDLGSAVLSAELALEFLPVEMQAKTLLCAGALVEGGIAAAVQAGLGSDLETVGREARHALQAKLDHFAAGTEAGQATQPPAPPGQTITVTLVNPHGLHARPAARLIQAAAAFNAKIWVANATTGKGPASARSLNGLATLGAVKGHNLTLTASGPDAEGALQALNALVSSGFGEFGMEEALRAEMPGAPTGRAAVSPGSIQGIPVSEGIALGPLYVYQPLPPPVPDYQADDPEAEWEKLKRAIHQASLAIQERRRRLVASLGEAKAAIFDAHLLLLQDPELLQTVRQRIISSGLNAAAAWQITLREAADRYDALDDPYQRARRLDVIDAGNQVLFSLVGQPPPGDIRVPGPVILAAEELTVGEVSQLDVSQVVGLVTASGGRTSHSAILSRSLGIPAAHRDRPGESAARARYPAGAGWFQGIAVDRPGAGSSAPADWTAPALVG